MALGPLVAAYRSQAEELRAVVLAYLDASWAALGGEYADAAMTAWAAGALAFVEAGQSETGALTAGYLVEALGVELPPPEDAELTSTEALRGVPGDVVWDRPAETIWSALGAGVAVEDAGARGKARARSLAETGLVLAATHTARAWLAGSGISGYRRSTRGARSCELCRLAASQRYSRGDLMPIHPGCHCVIDPIVGAAPAPARAALAAYRKAVVVRDHGEIGPVLAVAGQHFTGPGDLP